MLVRTFQVPLHDDVDHAMVIKHLPELILVRETESIMQHAKYIVAVLDLEADL